MLTKHEAATIRAALRYWIDEIVPHDESVAKPYFDTDEFQRLSLMDVESVIDRFQETNLRFAAIDSKQQWTRDQAEYRIDRVQYQTIILPKTSDLGSTDRPSAH